MGRVKEWLMTMAENANSLRQVNAPKENFSFDCYNSFNCYNTEDDLGTIDISNKEPESINGNTSSDDIPF